MLDLDKTNFEEEVLKADGYVLVDFYGDGCVPCPALMQRYMNSLTPTVTSLKLAYPEHHQGTSSCYRSEGSRPSGYGDLQRW